MKEKLLKIINNYGVYNQQRKFQEEVFEVQDAITVYETELLHLRDETDKQYIETLKEDIAEEIADVCVILREFMEYYGISRDEITEIMEYKINRQIERMKNNG